MHCCCLVTGEIVRTDGITILFRKLHAECWLIDRQGFNAPFSTLTLLFGLTSSQYLAKILDKILNLGNPERRRSTPPKCETLHPFHDHRDSLSAADASGCESIAFAPSM